MKHCVLIYQVVDDYVERRTPFGAEHLALAQAASAGVDDAAGRYGDSRAAVGSALYRAVRMSQSSGNNRTSTILRR